MIIHEFLILRSYQNRSPLSTKFINVLGKAAIATHLFFTDYVDVPLLRAADSSLFSNQIFQFKNFFTANFCPTSLFLFSLLIFSPNFPF